MAEYVNPAFETEPIQVEATIYEYIRSVFTNWNPREPHLVTIQTEAYAEAVAELMRLASDVPPEIFKYFGRLVGIEPIEPQFAYADTTWTMIDNAGYTIPEGTTVRLLIGGDEYAVFETVEDVAVPAGSTSTPAGAVRIQAVEAGADASGLSTQPELMDILDYVQSVSLVGTTAGGQDEEDIDTYLDRLSTRLQLLADRPILPRDFEILARTVVGVTRALALDGYNPTNQTFNNERMVTMIVLDENGQPVSGALETTVKDTLEAAREVNFIVHMGDPTYTTVNIVATVRAYQGYDVAALDTEITNAVLDYLHPKNWGKPRFSIEDENAWINTTVVRHYEVAEIINGVPGVNYIESLTINGSANTDLTLTGVAPLPATNSTATITVNLP